MLNRMAVQPAASAPALPTLPADLWEAERELVRLITHSVEYTYCRCTEQLHVKWPNACEGLVRSAASLPQILKRGVDLQTGLLIAPDFVGGCMQLCDLRACRWSSCVCPKA